MTLQEELCIYLKKKGIGPIASKSLKEEEVDRLDILFNEKEVSLTTKATFLTAILMLESNPFEKKWLNKIDNKINDNIIPKELHCFVRYHYPMSTLQKLINKVIQKDNLTQEEAKKAVYLMFEATTPDYEKASFLEAQRLKRETFEENSAFLTVLKEKISPVEINTDSLIDICDCYDGFNRYPATTLFTAPIIASLGYKVYLHGIDEVAPKNGITIHKLLAKLGKNPLKSIIETTEDIQNIGWGYLDQKVYFNELYQWKKMRKEMVKRPFLATFEKLLQPIRAKKNYLATAYTHKHYRLEVIKLISELAQVEKGFLIKGIEGSTPMNPSKSIACMLFDQNGINEVIVTPSEFQAESKTVNQDRSITIDEVIKQGLNALNGERNIVFDMIVLQAATLIKTFHGGDPIDIAQRIIKNIDNGNALNTFNQF